VTPARIVSLSPNTSLVLFALGEGHRVVGKTAMCLKALRQWVTTGQAQALVPGHASDDLLAHWEKIPDLGTWLAPDREQVRKIKPDLVLSSGTITRAPSSDLGVEPQAYVHFDTRRFEQIFDELRAIGTLIGREAQAESILTRLRSQVQELLGKLRDPKPTRFFHEKCVCIKTESFANPAKFVMAGGHLLPDLITMVGGEYPFVAPGEESRWIESQEVIAFAPEVILENRCFRCPVQKQNRVAERPYWSGIPALQAGRIFSPSVNLSNPSLVFPVGLAELVEFMNRID
jgi:iron complex transport system substrate-binding protein